MCISIMNGLLTTDPACCRRRALQTSSRQLQAGAAAPSEEAAEWDGTVAEVSLPAGYLINSPVAYMHQLDSEVLACVVYMLRVYLQPAIRGLIQKDCRPLMAAEKF